ncbi:helix-turn-helix domain-containing protein [Croceivirga thetidis]|uniref:AraC family transcriptional regulator n=1 Tax=Croceivirga thetidis TaxID=2721623 RepID=A0ABX1GLK5_9FLAO|nr:helix-turn-helix domain-containing protein [Croceivirga thetidis]NKI30788.1 AraC family transcriptional regulator [Croceivirga thetidis]
MKKVKEILLACLLCLNCVTAQNDLSSESFDELLNKIYENESNDSIQMIYINAYLNKAKLTNDFDELSMAYYMKGVYVEYPNSLKYLDSAITIGEGKKSNKFLPHICLEYGYALFNNSRYFEAFQKFIQAKRTSDSLGLKNISFNANTNIAFLKQISGDYAGAKDIYLENSYLAKSLFKGEDLKEERLLNYQELAYAYLMIDQYDSATYYNRLGYSLSKNYPNKTYPAIFQLVEGINQFKREKFQSAYDSIIKTESSFIEEGDSINLAFAYLYLGKIQFEEKDTLLGEKSLLKAYDALGKNPEKISELGEVYKLLWQINKKRNNKQKELFYLTELIEFQEAIKQEYNELSPAMINEFDIPKLVVEKEAVITSLKETNKLKTQGVRALIIGLVLVVAFAIFQLVRRRYYQNKLDEIIHSLEQKSVEHKKDKKVELDGISEEVLDEILKKLSDFEAKNQFLDANLTLSGLAKKLNTNSSYLSKVVNLHKNENFSKYLRGLRIDYITKELIKNEKIRNFTIKAIAIEAGFNSAETFSKSFRESNGMYPSRFIKQLTKKGLDL